MWTMHDVRSVSELLAELAPKEVAEHLDEARERIGRARDRIADDVARTSIAQLPAAFPVPLCVALDAMLRSAPWVVSERVETPEGNWTIDLIDNSYQPLAEVAVHDPFSALCLTDEFIATIAELSGYGDRQVITTRRWVNRYGPDDGIAPHEDTTGDFQIMICLSAPPPSFGGRLVLANGATADLQQGDLLVMTHADVLHWTTPLAADTPHHRATATCRYYVEGGRLPRSKVLPHTEAGPRVRSGATPA
jgi:hypothetical protein